MYSTYFVNNKTYGADDINTVMARLTTQGVSLFKDTGNMLIDINAAMSEFVDAGVELYDTESCKVVALGNDRFKISKGCCWMPSGSCIIFDDDGYVFTPNFLTESGASSSRCYIYLRQGGDKSSGTSNEISIIISPERYTESDIPLASISASRVVSDKRIFAHTKLSTPGGNVILECNTYLDEKDSPTVTITPPFSGYRYIAMLNHTNQKNQSGGKPVLLSEEAQYIGGDSYSSIYVKRSGNDITFSSMWNTASGYGGLTVNYLLF